MILLSEAFVRGTGCLVSRSQCKHNFQTLYHAYYNFASSHQGHSAILNPVYGTPAQPAPSFFNPAQFSAGAPSFPPTPTSAYAPAPVRSSPSCQLPAIVQESFNAVPEPTGSATLSPVQISVGPLTNRTSHETVPPSLQNLVSRCCFFFVVDDIVG